ncbi:MAG: hypothetical protein K9H26_19535 [Prolixibacteraceae bacterium]|nr:hypothetical protein [Prolixibacteraceae bacterium]
MIYRYFNKECYKCVLADLDLIKKWGSKIGFENIIVLPNIPKNKNEKILLQTTLENLFYYSVECSNFRIDPGSKIDQRFFAIIDRNGFAKFIFFPQSNNIDISNEYFESMSIMFDENSDTVF